MVILEKIGVFIVTLFIITISYLIISFGEFDGNDDVKAISQQYTENQSY